MNLFYYFLSSFLVSTLVFMMNKLPIFNVSWVVCIVLGVLIMAMLDKVFLDEENDSDF